MTIYNFNKDISRVFYPTENDLPVFLPTQTPTIYIFDTYPGQQNATTGTGKIGSTISTWTQTSTPAPYNCTYTIPAIADPNPTSSISSWVYFEAINFITQLAGTSTCVIRSFELERPAAPDGIPATTFQDCLDVYPFMTNYATEWEIKGYITLAEEEIKLNLKSNGIRWGQAYNLIELKRAIAYLAIKLFSESQINSDGDKFVIRREIYKEKVKDILGVVKLLADKDKDGYPESKSKGMPELFIIGR